MWSNIVKNFLMPLLKKKKLGEPKKQNKIRWCPCGGHAHAHWACVTEKKKRKKEKRSKQCFSNKMRVLVDEHRSNPPFSLCYKGSGYQESFSSRSEWRRVVCPPFITSSLGCHHSIPLRLACSSWASSVVDSLQNCQWF